MKGTGAIILYILILASQCNMAQTSTPTKYLNNVVVPGSVYQQDSLWLATHLKARIREKSGSFNNKEYYDSTQVIIDSIIYSPEKDKIVFFAIAKNPMHRRIYKRPSDEKHDFYYDAFAYLGRKSDSAGPWETMWFSTLNLSNYYDLEETSERIRWKYFKELVTVKDTNGASTYKYNVDDVRFWESPAWQKYFK